MVETRGQMSVADAGRKGGKSVNERYGKEFYSEIGKKGAASLRNTLGEQNYNDHLKEIASKGGQASRGRQRLAR